MIPLVCCICLLILLLLTPLTLGVRLDTTPMEGWGRIRLFWGPIPLFTLPLQISLLAFPYLTVRVKNRLFYLPELLAPRPQAFMPPVHFEKIEGTVYVGLREDGAATAVLTGSAWVLIKTLGEGFFESAAFRPEACFGMNIGRIKLEGILFLHPGETLIVYLRSLKNRRNRPQRPKKTEEKRSKHGNR